MDDLRPGATDDISVEARKDALFRDQKQEICRRIDYLFAGLLIAQWIGGIILALVVSPRTWAGTTSTVHIHVWTAVLLGGVIASFPVALALLMPGRSATRWVIAMAQMLFSCLLIHLTGGRIETHFHIFGSLAFLAFYRDWRVYIPATAVILVDHFTRGIFWPQSVYGVLTASPWRTVEHAGWVIFENIFLVGACIQGVREMRDVAGKRAQLEHANRDLEAEIARRELTEEALIKSRERLRLVTENVSDVIWSMNPGGRFTYISPSVERERGFTPDEVMEMGMKEFLTPESYASINAIIEKVVPGKLMESRENFSIGPIEIESRRKDGSLCWNELKVTFDREASGKLIAIHGVSRDISERKAAETEKARLEDQLRQGQKMEAIGTLAGGLAHDFNNLLGGILGYSNMLRLDPDDPEKVRRAAAVIEKAADKMSSLTRQLLGFARKGKMQILRVDLHDLIDEVSGLLSRTIDKKIEIIHRYRAPRPEVMGDPAQLEQVILNLAVNARDAMTEGGSVIFETEEVEFTDGDQVSSSEPRAGRYVRLSVVDSGVGIAPEVKDRIFEPFFTTKEPGKGTGMGLAMSYGIVENHGGHIAVYSELGLGTTFHVYLPLAGAETAESADRQTPGKEPVQGTGTILIVDDEDIIRETAHAMLTSLGYQVMTANDGREAVEYFKAHSGEIDLVLVDMMMPHMNGHACFNKLREIDPDVRAILSSGYSREGAPQEAIGDGMMGFVQKPYRIYDLSTIVASALAGPIGMAPEGPDGFDPVD